MSKWRNYFIITLLLCCSLKLCAQWESPITQYWDVKGYYNPSYAGITNNINTNAIYKYQWAGIEGAPSRVVFTADMPFTFLNNRHGAGIIAFTENIGSLRNTLLAAQYSLKQQIGKGTLNIGLQAGIYNLRYDAGSVNLVTTTDQASLSKISANTAKKQVADISVGISWTAKRFYVGLSSLHVNQPVFYVSNATGPTDNVSEYPLNNPSENPDNNSLHDFLNNSSDSIKSHIPLSFNLTAGYNIQLLNSFEIQPMILLLSNSSHTFTQATVQLKYDNKYSGGISWISDDEYSIFAGTTMHGLGLGYAYTIHKSGFGKDSKGSHELYLKYNFSVDYFKSQSHKSIRIL